ncbi:ComEA family DNA-binding protein [Brevibacterium yomogidense]|uniref:ComEA family DNA-binding protein n=1 Tax=Brevibacterium yomogidense TaxID=946573 RepID=UPI0018DF9C52|nr:ComEA family DNA-binding protein [Brevibacterium yomogidense]
MSPSPAERFSALLARSGEKGWSPDDDLGDEGGIHDDRPPADRRNVHHRHIDVDEDDVDDEDGDRVPTGVRPGLSRTLLLCLLGVALTAVLVLVLAPSLLRGESPLAGPEEGSGWESTHAENTSDPTDAAASHGADPDDAEATAVYVHVVGAVNSPGVVDLPPSSRVSDAVEAAGGAVADADIDALNLARELVDGEQIRVLRVGEEPAPAAEDGGAGAPGVGVGGGGGDGTDATAAGGGLIDLNAADAAQLETLPGVGPVTAQSIIDHREAIGRFGSVDELLDVTGIGDATLARIRESVTVG